MHSSPALMMGRASCQLIQVAPAELEALIITHPAVADVVVAVKVTPVGTWHLNEEYNTSLKVVAPDMASYQDFLSSYLLKIGVVRTVNTSFVLKQQKNTTALPLEQVK